MANRTWHINFSLIAFGATMALLVYIKSYTFVYPRDYSWLTLAFLLSVFGAQFPDLDLIWGKLFAHRDWFFHSAFPSLLMMGLVYLSRTVAQTHIVYPLLAFFNIGMFTHLILDYFPTWKEKSGNDLDQIMYAADWVATGITGEEITQKMSGTYLIHLPRFFWKDKTISKFWTRIYLFSNGFVLLGLAILQLYLFNSF